MLGADSWRIEPLRTRPESRGRKGRSARLGEFLGETSCIAEVGCKRGADYDLCFRDGLLRRIAELALEGTRAMGVALYSSAPTDSIAGVLNESWSVFWNTPNDFVVAEKDLMKRVSAVAAESTH